MKKYAWLAIGAVAAIAAGCGGSSGGSSSGGSTELPGGTALDKVGTGEGQLNLIVWAGYAEDGSTDPAVDWVTPFAEATGCKVTSKTANTSDEMVSLIKSGEYDGVSASGNASVRLILGGDAAPINTDLIKSYAEINPILKDQPYNSLNGQMYGVPHGWGANLLMTADAAGPNPTSWKAVYEPDAAVNGKVTIYDDPMSIAEAANYLKTAKPELGITDPYELDEAQFTATVDLLKKQRPAIGQYWKDYTKQMEAFAKGARRSPRRGRSSRTCSPAAIRRRR